MKILFKNPSQIITCNTEGKNYKRGKEMNQLDVLNEHSILVEDGSIKGFIPNNKVSRRKFDKIIDCENKIILPGLIECHTHTAYAGSRATEFKQILSGADYEEIAKKGGGIRTTVEAVRNSSFEELIDIISPRIQYFIKQGITSLEIKSGYGLSFYDEIKLLQVINHLNKINKIDIYPTFLGAHTFPAEYKNDHSKYIEMIKNEMIPFIAEKKMAVFCDAFCESTAFSVGEIDSIFEMAVKSGLKIKLHTEQFNRIGGLELALKYNAISADHLEVLLENQIPLISESETVAVLLPGVSFFLGYDYAPARKLIENNAIVALATDYNPGSSHISNLNLIMSIASLQMKLSVEETISAVTINSAKALDINDKVGSLELGKKADFAIFDAKDYSEIVYQVGKNILSMTVKEGEIIYKN